MKKLILSLGLVLLFINKMSAQGFSISGSQLLDANGNNFVMKGINVPLAWFVNDVNNNIANIKNVTGSNCFRIVVTTSTPDNAWQTCVQKCIDNKIIPMVELHDVTGNNSPENLNNMAKFWASKADFITKPEIAKYILVNIANEWGDWHMSATPTGAVSRVTWRDAYVTAVKTIRDAGIKTTIVVDAGGYGQDNKAQTLLSYAKDVQASDPYHNCLFSIHMYCEWSVNGNSTITTHLPAVKNAGIPVIVGEFGYQHSEGTGTCDIDEVAIINTANANGIGWLAWSWKGNGGGVEYLDLSTDWAGTALSPWGNTVVNGAGGTKTATEATVFNPSSPVAPVVAITYPTETSTNCAGQALEITATASIASGSVSKVDFYDGATLLGSDDTAPYTYSWANPATGAHTIRAIAVSALNVSSVSATVNVNVGLAPVASPSIKVGTGPWQALSTVIVAANTEVVLGPQPSTGGSWAWSGCGTSGSSREQQLNITEACIAHAIYTNDCGLKDTIVYTINLRVANCCGQSAPNGVVYCCTDSDPDGDGWGWENSASCVVPGSAPDAAKCGVISSIVDAPLLAGIELFPSPCKETLHIALPSQGTEAYILSLHTMEGHEISTQHLIAAASSLSVDVSFLNTGMYVVKLRSKNRTYTQKFTKE